MAIDVPEGDNGCKGDGLRYLSGAVNIDGKAYLTMESVTGRAINRINLADVLTEVTHNFSHGVNRHILHGTPYSKTLNAEQADWPGWMPFRAGSFGSAYTYRQIWWEDATATMTNYMSRIEAVLQKGTAKIDFAVLLNQAAATSMGNGNTFQAVLDAGYSYNRVSEAMLEHPSCVVEDGVLCADGPEYKALVLDRVSIISLNGMQTVLDYAKAGLPIVIQSGGVTGVYGSKTGDDALVKELFEELKTISNVRVVSSANAVVDALRELEVTPYASYGVSRLEATLYKDDADGTNYYYMYNNTRPNNSGMLANGQGASYKGDTNAINKAVITLEGSGVPYKLDAFTGEVAQVGQYTDNGDGTVTFVLDKLMGGEAVIYAITENTTDFPKPAAYVKSVDNSTADYSIVQTSKGLALRSNTPGAYTVTMSDNATVNVAVEKALSTLSLSSEKWDLVIDSYGPKYPNASGKSTKNYASSAAMVDENGIMTVDPSETVISTVDFGEQSLGNWKDISATAEQLALLNFAGTASGMQYVAGVGYYTLTFDAPADWDENTGAYLDVAYGSDQIGSYIVNGVEIKEVSNITDRVDLAGLLLPGKNTITIKLSTTLFPRAFYEHHGYSGSIASVSNGLTGVTLTPYTQIELAASADNSIAAGMIDPKVKAKPMARMWFPDAGAGWEDEDGQNYLWMVEKQIKDMYDAGFGGVEITMLADENSMTTANSKKFGWGSAAYVNIIKTALTVANNEALCPGGFIIDVTITAHWPPTINTVDPNDDGQQQEYRTQTQVLSREMAEAALSGTGSYNLKLPTMKVADQFIFTNTIIAVAAARVTAAGATPTVAFDTIDKLTGKPTGVTHAAGVLPGSGTTPVTDRVADVSQGEYYPNGTRITLANDWSSVTVGGATGTVTMSTTTTDLWDWKANATSGYPMKNIQNEYAVDNSELKAYLEKMNIDPADLRTAEQISALSTPQAGDIVIMGSYRQGTGQKTSGGGGSTLMIPRYYVTDYFNEAGAKAVTDYWEKYMLDATDDINSPNYVEGIMDTNGRTLRELFQANANKCHVSAIFEDSIEASFSATTWTAKGVEEFYNLYGYSCEPYLFNAVNRGSAAANVTGDNGYMGRVTEDIRRMLATLYAEKHAKPISEWTKTFGYSYRAQAYSLSGLDVVGAAVAVDIPEGDNSSNGDGLRKLRSAANLKKDGYRMLSMEALTVGNGVREHLNWNYVISRVNSDASDGVNRLIFHGSNFVRTYAGDARNGTSGSTWPGWTWNFAKYSAAQTWWDDAHILADYISALQAMLQGGSTKVEFAVLTDIPSNFSQGSGDGFAAMMNAGYMYNNISEAVFSQIDAATDSNGNGVPDDLEGGMIRNNLGGPGYKALVVNNATYMSVSAANTIKAVADAGIPVIFYGANTPFKVYGTEKHAGEDAEVKAIIDGLIADSGNNVYRATTQEQIIDILKDDGIEPYVSYDFTDESVAQVQTTTQIDEATGTYYYLLYNNNATGYVGSSEGRPGSHTKGANGMEPKAGSDLSFSAALTGQTQYAYEFDLHTQTIKPLDNYTVADGKIVANIDLPKNECKVIIVKGADETSGLFPTFDTEFTKKTFAGTINLPGAGWTMDLQSWSQMFTVAETNTLTGTNGAWVDPVTFFKVPEGTPDAIWQNIVNPEFSVKTNVTLEGVKLGIWDTAVKKDFYLTDKDPMSFEKAYNESGQDITDSLFSYLALGESNVTSMAKIVGRAIYRNTFDVNTGGIDGIELTVDHNQEMIGYVRINGTVYDKEVNPMTGKLFVEKSALNNGENSIEILIMTPYGHRSLHGSSGYTDDSSNFSALSVYGINTVSYRPYVNNAPLAVSVSTSTIVETLGAYLNITVGGAPEGAALSAYLEADGEQLGEIVSSSAGKLRMYLKAAPAQGTYRLIVTGDGFEGSCEINVVEYNTNIWTATPFAGEDGFLSIKFNAQISSKTGFVKAVKIGDQTFNGVQVGDDVLKTGAMYDSIPEGGKIVVSGVKYPVLFPSYSFTFTVTK